MVQSFTQIRVSASSYRWIQKNLLARRFPIYSLRNSGSNSTPCYATREARACEGNSVYSAAIKSVYPFNYRFINFRQVIPRELPSSAPISPNESRRRRKFG